MAEKLGMTEEVDVDRYRAIDDMPRWFRTMLDEFRMIVEQIEDTNSRVKHIEQMLEESAARQKRLDRQETVRILLGERR